MFPDIMFCSSFVSSPSETNWKAKESSLAEKSVVGKLKFRPLSSIYTSETACLYLIVLRVKARELAKEKGARLHDPFLWHSIIGVSQRRFEYLWNPLWCSEPVIRCWGWVGGGRLNTTKVHGFGNLIQCLMFKAYSNLFDFFFPVRTTNIIKTIVLFL